MAVVAVPFILYLVRFGSSKSCTRTVMSTSTAMDTRTYCILVMDWNTPILLRVYLGRIIYYLLYFRNLLKKNEKF